jgi:hypothetical protein
MHVMCKEQGLLVFFIVGNNRIHYGNSKCQGFPSPSFRPTNHVPSLHRWLKDSFLVEK